jgi:hypothetical protein
MQEETRNWLRSSLIYFIICVIAGVAGIASRNYPDYIPEPISKYLGDTLWAFAMFFLLSILFPGRSALMRAIITLTIAVIVEITQLYHAPWIDAIRETSVGGLVLGFGFHWGDFICYIIGAVLAAALETLILERMNLP